MAASTWTWLGNNGSVNASSNWLLSSGPGNAKNRPQSGDTANITGAGVSPQLIDSQLTGGTTLDLAATGAVQFLNDTNSFNTTSIDSSSLIDATGTATSILAEGTFTNSGTIEVTGTGNHLSINVTSDVANSVTLAGWFENDGSIIVGAGDSLTVTAAAGATFVGSGTLSVPGGSALIDGALPTFSNDANFSISQNGSLEIEQSGTSAQPNISFNGPGTLKLDQPGNFAGTINGFVLGDTIDLGILNVASVVYDGNGDIALIGNGGTVFTAQSNNGELGGNGGGNFLVSSTSTIAGDVIVTQGNGGDTLLTAAPPRTWMWANGASASANTAADWTVIAGPADPGGFPGSGDTAINAGGTILGEGNLNLVSNTIDLGGTASTAALLAGSSGGGNQPTNFMNPSLDDASVITSVVPGNTTPETSLLGVAGAFVNEGSIIADGPAGSSFTIAVAATTVNGTLEPGYFINYKSMEVDAGNTLDITVAANSEFFNVSEILVNGGSLLFDAQAGAIDGGYAGGSGAIVIAGGGTAETNSTYLPTSTSSIPIYAFADSTAGNTLKIDNIGSFGGAIVGFGLHDTIDLGASIAVDTIAYSRISGILYLENAGTIVDSLVFGSGNFLTGTTALSGGVAGSFTIGTGSDGDTILITNVQNDVFTNASGSWQTSGLWSNGTPGTLASALIGFGASSPFTLTTGNSPVSIGAPVLVGGLLQVTSATTVAPYPIRQFGGTLEVTSGNVLTSAQLFVGGGDDVIDPTGTVDLTGHSVYGSTGAINGLITISPGNTRALALGSGSLLVNGGVLNAGTGQAAGSGGAFHIGVDGGGTPASVTVQNSGANAGVVTDLYTDLGSDPTSAGSLTINGNGTPGGATWTDQIDPGESAFVTTGFMLIGYDNQGTLTGTVTPPPFSGTATLAVENGATLTEQTYAIIGHDPDSAGSVQIAGGLWNIGTGPLGGFLTVGDSSTSAGTLEVDAGGTVQVAQGGTFINNGTSFVGSNVAVGLSAQASGTIIVQNGGLLTGPAAVEDGITGLGTVQVLNGGTIQSTGTNAFNVGLSAGGFGSLIVSGVSNGTPASVTDAAGLDVGLAGTGVAQVLNGGTFQLTGTNPVSVGVLAGSSGTMTISGQSNGMAALLSDAGGMAIGSAGQGTMDVLNGGTLRMTGTLGISVGNSASGVGSLLVSGNASEVIFNTTAKGITAGALGKGTVDVENGGTIALTGSGGFAVGQSASGIGVVIVNGSGALITEGSTGNGMGIGQGVSATGSVLVENGGNIVLGGAASGDGIGIGQASAAKGTLDIESGGTVLMSGAGLINVGQAAGGSGLVIVNGTNALLKEGTTSTGLEVGQTSNGTLEVENAGTVLINSITGGLKVGQSGTGLIVVSGTNATFSVNTGSGPASVGGVGQGTLQVQSAGTATFADGLAIGSVTGGTGVVSVSGIGSALTITGPANVGDPGTGTMSVGSGGSVSVSGGVFIAIGGSTSHGTVTVAGGTLTTPGVLTVGGFGSGVLNIQTGGVVQATGTLGAAVGGFNGGANGIANINGGTLSVTGGNFLVGNTNVTGTLTVSGGGSLITGGPIVFSDINATSGGSAAATVSGGTWTSSGSLIVGDTGKGSLDINSGGTVSLNSGPSTVTIGQQSGGAGTISLESGGQLVANFITISAISTATGTLSVAGGAVTAGTLQVNAGGTASVSSGSIASSSLTIGGAGAGAALTVSGGNVSSSIALSIAPGASSTGAVTVSGGTLSSGGQLTIGGQGSGVLTLDTGGSLVAADGVALGVFSGGGGSLVMNGGNATDTGALDIEAGSVLIGGGSTFTANGTGVGDIAVGNGALTVSGGTLNGVNEILSVGGSMLVENAGTVTTSFAGTAPLPLVDVNATGGNQAIVQVTGGNSVWDVTASGGEFDVGDGGSGSVSVSAGGMINAGTNMVNIGNESGDAGTITVSDGGTMFAVTQSNLSSALNIGEGAGATGNMTVTGLGSKVTATGQVNVGDAGIGSLLISNQATMLSGGAAVNASQGVDVGQALGGAGVVTVSGAQSELSNTGEFVVGDSSLGSLEVASGGTVITSPGTVGGLAGLVVGNTSGAAGSSVDVSGTGSDLAVTGLLDVGVNGSGGLQISGGATVTASSLDAANVASAVGQISVSGAGTKLSVTGPATVADDGTGVLSVLDGATFSATNLTIGAQTDSSGAMVVSGTGSTVNLTGALNIGTALGTGDLTVGPGAAIHAGVINQFGQVVDEGGLLDPTVLLDEGTDGGTGTIASDFIIDEGTIAANSKKAANGVEVVSGTVVGGGTLTISGGTTLDGTTQNSPGLLLLDNIGTLEVQGPVLNAADTTFGDNGTPNGAVTVFGTYDVQNSVVDVTFLKANEVLVLDDIPGFAGTVTSTFGGDRFVITGGTLSNLGVSNGDTLTMSDSGAAGGTDRIMFSGPVSAAGFDIVNGNTLQVVACFAAGTRIGTDHGPVAVEDLHVGDRVATAEGGCEPIVWIGQRAVNCAAHPSPESVWPVQVRVGAFGANVPVRELYLSPDHAVFVNNVLVPVKLLVNGTSIAQVKPDRVTYYHVELPQHTLILAEGLPVESYLDVGDRWSFVGGAVTALHPDFTARTWEMTGCAPLVLAGERLLAARTRLAEGVSKAHRVSSAGGDQTGSTENAVTPAQRGWVGHLGNIGVISLAGLPICQDDRRQEQKTVGRTAGLL